MPTKLKNSYKMPQGQIIGEAEVVTLGSSAQSLADHGATVPSFTTQILVTPLASGALHWLPKSATPTSSFGHAVAAFEPFVLEQDQKTAKIIPDSGTPDVLIVYTGYKRF